MTNSTEGNEYLCLHVGQAGINIGNKCWELYCLEHEIEKDGTLIKNNNNNTKFNNHKLDAFFKLSSNDRYSSRAIFIDFEPDVIDTIPKSSNSFYHPEQFIHGKNDASNIFTRGYCLFENDFNESVCKRIRYELEQCDNRINGIQICSSLCGGTGSGYTSYLLQSLYDYDKKIPIQQLSLIPSLNNCSTHQTSIDIYNTVLSLYYNLLYSGLTVLFDNEALYNVYDRNYLCRTDNDVLRSAKKESIVNFNEINNIVAHAISKLTSTLRFQSTINKTMYEQQLNLQIPNQSDSLHFPIISYAPIVSQQLNSFSNNDSLLTLSNACLHSSNQLLKLKNNNNKMLNGCLVYACDQNIPQSEHDNKLLQKNYEQFKRGFVDHNLKTLPNDLLSLPNKSALLLGNSLDIIDVLSEMLTKFHKMYKRKAFVYRYMAGLSEVDMEEAYRLLENLHEEYSQINQPKTEKYLSAIIADSRRWRESLPSNTTQFCN